MQESVSAKRPLIGGIGLDWLVTIMSLWFVGGVYVDGWAHNHDVGVETFFTPWHAMLYSGFAVTAAAIVGAVLLNRLRGHGWRQSIPGGYELGLLGVFIFTAGGMGDMVWHIVFGIEDDVEALLSPTHLLLALGATLMVSVPWRAAWRRLEVPKGLRHWLPVLCSMAFSLAIIAFMTQFAHPLKPEAIGLKPIDAELDFLKQSNGITGILLQTTFMMGVTLLAMRRWRLPIGSLTFLFGVTALGMSFMEDQFRLILPAFMAGLSADLLAWKLKPSIASVRALRLFAFLAPAVYFALYFATLMATGGIWWTVHFWSGSIVLAGAISWLMTYLLVPPKLPAGV